MALLTAQTLPATGAVPTLSAVTSSDTVSVGGDGFILFVKNTGASSCTVTIPQRQACSLGGVSPTHDKVRSVPNDSAVYAIPISPYTSYVDPTTGVVTVNYSLTTGVTAGVVAT